MEPSTTPVSSALHHPPPSAPASASSSANPQHGCQPPHHPLDHLSPSPVSNSSTAAVDPSRNLASSPGKWADNMATSSGAPESRTSSPPSAAAAHQASSRPGMKNRIPFSIVAECPQDIIYSEVNIERAFLIGLSLIEIGEN